MRHWILQNLVYFQQVYPLIRPLCLYQYTCGVNPGSERVDGHDEGDGGVLAAPGHQLGQHSLAVLTQAGHSGAQMLLTYIHVLICQPNTHNIQIKCNGFKRYLT